MILLENRPLEREVAVVLLKFSDRAPLPFLLQKLQKGKVPLDFSSGRL